MLKFFRGWDFADIQLEENTIHSFVTVDNILGLRDGLVNTLELHFPHQGLASPHGIRNHRLESDIAVGFLVEFIQFDSRQCNRGQV
jgi:mannitol/fructose-specific phosphotransferase system IIA component (Ntr-type)